MGVLRFGVHRELEDAADALIAKSLEGVTSQNAKKDILTPWKEKDRLRREVYVPGGVPDAAYRSGMYRRAHNAAAPHLNSNDGGVRSKRVNPDLIRESFEGRAPGDSWFAPEGNS